MACQDEASWLWDLCWILACAGRRAPASADQIRFALHVRSDNRDRTRPLVRLKVVCGPGDAGERVITFTLPDEN